MTIHRPTSSYYMVYRMQCIYGYVDIDMFIINALLNLLPVVCSYCSSLLFSWQTNASVNLYSFL